MGQNVIPKNGGTLLPWHRDLIPLLAMGFWPAQIAARLNVPVNRVDYAKQLPVVRAAVRVAQTEMWTKLGSVIADQMLQDAPQNIAFLQSVRDGTARDADGAAPPWRERVAAAARLLDSQVARKILRTEDGKVEHVLQVSDAERQRIEACARDAGVTLAVAARDGA
jgi:hypothetical protein